ncbi:MAG: hypothetical protein Q8P81_01615 [Nanoarchaeota archaeon]|nr:hypothetical protein [Nanoarchaeota archaeon]
MERKTKKTAKETSQREEGVGTECRENCIVHGGLKARGRTFKGVVVSRFPKRITIEFERMIYLRKYERYAKGRTKIHARVSNCM